MGPKSQRRILRARHLRRLLSLLVSERVNGAGRGQPVWLCWESYSPTKGGENIMAVSFKSDILPLFNATDIQHMSGMGVQLSSYPYMSNPAAGSVMGCGPFSDHGNAQAVYAALTG